MIRLQFIDEPASAFFQNNSDVDIRAGLTSFGVFDKGSPTIQADPLESGRHDSDRRPRPRLA
ncbi:Ethanolamine utilization protein EutJ (predicted chaperonin) [Bradyrhizobium embrapense]